MPTTPDVVLAMPAFNEEATIAGFLQEIAHAFESTSFHLVVVNDCSTDHTEQVLRELAEKTLPLTVYSNEKNSGHGPSTLTALTLAISQNPSYIVATDGDGHVTGQTLFDLYQVALNSAENTVIEGVRTQRDDPWFRKLVSFATRTLVRQQSGVGPTDANTPFRVYPREVAKTLLDQIPRDHLTPNLMMSTLVRRQGVPYLEVGIVPHKRKGADVNGSTWKQRFRVLPSRRFLKFCWDATAQWVRPQEASKS